jgi:flagellin-like hook-associated protein FlgL
MSDVTLSSAVRSSLLSLQNTTQLIDRTQGRLSTGLRVASSIDDPVSFFQAKTLNDRAFDFNEKKDGIDQGVSTVSAALEGIESIENVVRNLVVLGKSVTVNAIIGRLDSALTTLRSNAQTLGSNVALLQTRLDFTETYVNTLETGAAKLTLADINEEGANLLALQTRQQLGISALAFAGQAEQGILSLFR